MGRDMEVSGIPGRGCADARVASNSADVGTSTRRAAVSPTGSEVAVAASAGPRARMGDMVRRTWLVDVAVPGRVADAQTLTAAWPGLSILALGGCWSASRRPGLSGIALVGAAAGIAGSGTLLRVTKVCRGTRSRGVRRRPK